MITVCCALRSGGVYDSSWVSKLQRQVNHYCTVPHRFVCLTNTPVDCEFIEIEEDWPKWWCKIELFRHFTGPTLFLDLDSVIVDNIDSLVQDFGFFTMVRDFNFPDKLNSSVMRWTGDYSAITQAFEKEPYSYMTEFRTFENSQGNIGDQAFIEYYLDRAEIPVKTFSTDEVVSYKKHARKIPPPGSKIVCFHGSLKMDTAGGWVAGCWQ